MSNLGDASGTAGPLSGGTKKKHTRYEGQRSNQPEKKREGRGFIFLGRGYREQEGVLKNDEAGKFRKNKNILGDLSSVFKEIRGGREIST